MRRFSFLMGLFLLPMLSGKAFAVDYQGGHVIFNTNNSDSSGYKGADNMEVVSGGSLIVTKLDGGQVQVNDTFEISNNFIHNGTPTLVNDPSFHGQGSFSFIGDNASVTAKRLIIGNDFINGDGTSEWNLDLNIDIIQVGNSFNTAENSKLVINPDFAQGSTLMAENISIADGLYMGSSGSTSNASVNINSASQQNIYNIIALDKMDVDGDIIIETGKLNVIAKDLNVSNNIAGNIELRLDSLNVGGASLNGNSDWKQGMDRVSDGSGGYLGNIKSDGNIISTGDVIIGGSVDGEIGIKSDMDIWIGENLSGDWNLNAKDIYILGDVSENGNIDADNVNITGSVDGNINIVSSENTWVGENLSGDWNLETKDLSVMGNVSGKGNIIADNVNIGKNLSGDIFIDADKLDVGQDILGGIKIRPNLQNGTNGFHINPDTGISKDFKQMEINVDGTYYFNDDSYLQLVLDLNKFNADTALVTVGGFDASTVTRQPDFLNMNSTPNIEVLVDNINTAIKKIKLIEVAAGGLIDLGNLDFAGVWFYWDRDGDGINDTKLFQESNLIEENNNIYAILAMMDSIEALTIQSNNHNRNDVQAAKAVDDLILLHLKKYEGYAGDNLDSYYTSVMRILFGKSDVYYDLMLNGGNHRDAIDVMVSKNPNYAVDFVRGIGIGDAANLGNKLIMSSRTSKNSVTDQLLEDYVWKRYYDKNVGWVKMGFGSDIISFNFGADTKIKKFIVGFNLGYNMLDFDNLDGSTFNIGAYGTWDYKDWMRLYSNLNLSVHSVKSKINSDIIGSIDTKFTTTDVMLDIGALHKIFDTYITGRAYVTLGHQGGYKFTQEYKGQDFLDIKSDADIILAPGYEISIGKDIWFTVGSFMRPSLHAGVEYNLLGENKDRMDFKFSESGIWRNWETKDIDPLWIRYGGKLDFSFIVGTNISLGYSVLKNSDFKSNQFKINGVYRF